MTVRETDSDRRRVSCVGLSTTACWDESANLRGELLTVEALVEHAREVALAHGQPSMSVAAAPLRSRFAVARASLRQAYDRLHAAAAESKHVPAPAEEWLLDNAHVVSDQLREIEEDLPSGYLAKLPRLASGEMAGYPRVYALCLDYLRHTDARIELDGLVRYVDAYEDVSVLTIGELWAVPIMLRIGLVLSVMARAAVDDAEEARVRADRWSARLQEAGASSALKAFAEEPATPAFLVELMRRLREHDAPVGLEWVRARCAALGTTPDELARQYHLRQAADQVSVGNAITSMRCIAAFSWNEFFERVSVVERTLREDPGGAYALTDGPTRDRCRHAVEDIARGSSASEYEVAKSALELARTASAEQPSDAAAAHVGYYLIEEGRAELERSVGCRAPVGQRIRVGLARFPLLAYLLPLVLLSAVFAAAIAWAATARGVAPLPLAVIVTLLLIPLSEIALALTNAVVSLVFPPRLLAKLDFQKGIPEAYPTLVVVPCLLDGPRGVARLLADLETRALANDEREVRFALLSDFTDHSAEHRADDDELLALAARGIASLNQRHPRDGEPTYHLFHRRRLYNPRDGLFMGWERKRGKLEELNRLLRGDGDTSFSVVTAPSELLSRVRYVITLDADTALPRETARRLVATMAHPLNRPRLDPVTKRVVRGYGLLQPRVGTRPTSTRVSRFARLMAGPAGIDPYTSAVSDVYQDLFAEGSFVGKGIYDVDAFREALEGRVPENTLLSHDLFEGAHARTALVTDIELLDDQPSTYRAQASRDHRWVRGDWQLLPWIFGRGPAGAPPLPPAARFRMLDNLRRSLVAPALVSALLIGWLSGPVAASLVLISTLAWLAAPIVGRLVVTLARRSRESAWTAARTPFGDLGANAVQAALTLVLVYDRALLMTDAIARTIWRLFVSRRGLLEWTASSQAERLLRTRSVDLRTLIAAGTAVFTLLLLLVVDLRAVPFAAPVLLAWASAPLLVAWLGRPDAPSDIAAPLSPSDRRFLRLTALRTWLFFERFVGDADNHLPPDNFQEQPRPVVAHRTSPTNIGLYLLSTVAARDFGFVTVEEMLARLEATLATIGRLQKRDGHILNWYDTTTLAPLEPLYVSTVDSGNLAGYLITLSEAMRDLENEPLVSGKLAEAALDLLGWLDERLPLVEGCRAARDVASILRDELVAARPALDEPLPIAMPLLSELAARAAALVATVSGLEEPGLVKLANRLEAGLSKHLAEAHRFAPWAGAREVTLGEDVGTAWRQLREARSPAAILAAAEAVEMAASDAATTSGAPAESYALLDRSITSTREFVSRLRAVGAGARAFAEAMSFRPLYDVDRSLFAIGFNVSSGRSDQSHYDLLASEARLASFLAIAKGEVPLEHWFRLGRPRSDLETGRVLQSWSGSMFEYLMPILVMKRYAETLLDETYLSAVDRQIAYGRSRRVPWGVSESAYNTMDLSMTYQYRAFGVPGLGLKAGLGKDLVVAPYATVLASLVRADAAVQNLRALAGEGMFADLGFYESIDFTPSHLPPPRRSVIVRTFMAHHQGMSLVALDNVLHGGIMQARFHRDARVKATELLLQERIPVGAPLLAPQAATLTGPPPAEPEMDVVDHVGLDETSPQRCHLLGHAELTTLVDVAGAGFTTFKGHDIHRYREDASLGASGIFFYLRDVETGAYWSIGQKPTEKRPDSYDAAFSADKVEIRRRDGAIEALLEITVSPEHPADVRRITLTNHDDRPRHLELISYCEVVLAPRAADVAHPAFSSMFVETEQVASGAVLAHRRPRSSGDQPLWLTQALSFEDGEWRPVESETSRARFIGRGNTLANPAALSGADAFGPANAASVDPVLALRTRVELAPGRRARASLTTALAPSRDAAISLSELFASPSTIARSFELSWADARVELRHLGISGLQAKRFQELLSFVVQPSRALRFCPVAADIRGSTREALWAQGISGDLPIVIVRLDDSGFAEIVRELVLAHELWRLNGVEVDLVILNEEPSGYLQPMHDEVGSVLASTPAQSQLNQRAGVFLRRAEQLTHDGRTLLLAAARVVLTSSGGSLARQLRKALQKLPARGEGGVQTPRTRAVEQRRDRDLAFENGIGGFADGGREYVMGIDDSHQTPAPWCNVMANASFGSLVSERGSSYTWSQNSQSHRLTPWSNDAVSDPSGELFFVRDDETLAAWSPTPAPLAMGRSFEVRHGQGATTFVHEHDGLAHELVMFVDAVDPVKVSRLRLTNTGSRARRLTIFGVVEWVLGTSREAARVTVVTDWLPDAQAVVAQNPFSNFPDRRAFFGVTGDGATFTCDRQEVFGLGSSRSAAAMLDREKLEGAVGAGLDPCAAISIAITLFPGETKEVAFVLGDANDLSRARELLLHLRQPGRVDDALARARGQWDRLLSTVVVRTPDAAMDVLANRWLLYQAVSARIWGRTAFYQSGGAYGFRDQLQDVLALLHADRSLARDHILRSAARQFTQGDVQHWWHPGTGEGVRTRCSDDLAWLPFAVARYVTATADRSILDVVVPFLDSRPLKDGEDDLFIAPNTSSESATLYEHATRALDAAITQGAHGLPLMGAGDWNDGMNRVGEEGAGESIWLAWFLVRTLKDFIPLAEARGDGERVQRCQSEIVRMVTAVEAHGWDGQWYLRAIFDDGSPMGSAANAECRIDAIAQSWAVLAGADSQRARTAMQMADQELVDADHRLMRLLTPPFTGAQPDPGYIAAYPPGVRENGGQYTHGALWSALAQTALGDGGRAAELLSLLNPIHHSTDGASRERYAVEPYVVAADVYSAPGLEGRGGWTWYTGSAAWMYRVFVEHVLGVTLKGGALQVTPCIPSSWPGFEVDYRDESGTLTIRVENPSGLSVARTRVEIDGVPSPSGLIPLGVSGHREVRLVMLPQSAKGSPLTSRLSGSSLGKA